MSPDEIKEVGRKQQIMFGQNMNTTYNGQFMKTRKIKKQLGQNPNKSQSPTRVPPVVSAGRDIKNATTTNWTNMSITPGIKDTKDNRMWLNKQRQSEERGVRTGGSVGFGSINQGHPGYSHHATEQLLS